MHEEADITRPGELLQEPRAWSGKTTPEYERVKTNFSSITGALKSNPSATESLRDKFKEQGWLTPTGKPTEEELVTHALGRIELDPNQYGKFIAMLSDVTGLDLIVNILTGSATKQGDGIKETKEEHDKATGPEQSSRAAHRPSLQKHDLHDLPAKPCKPGRESQVDSGVVNDVGTPDTTDIEPPNSSPPGSFSRPAFRIPPQTAPPLVSGGASVNFTPDVGSAHLASSEGLDVDEGSCKATTHESDDGKGSAHTGELVGHKKTISTVAAEDIPVPDSSESINTIAQQQEVKPDAAVQTDGEDSPRIFTVGSSAEQAEVENGDERHPDQQLSVLLQSEVTKRSQSEQDLAMAYQRVYASTESIVQIRTAELNKQIEQLKKQIANLQQELSEVRMEKQALQDENEQLSDDLARYETNAKQKEEAANKELQDIKRELENCNIAF